MTDAEPQFGTPGKKAGRQAKKTWKDMTPQQRTGSIIGGLIQLVLAAIAWTDLARRPAEQVNGPKPLWALAITINFIGPISYFIWGRRQPGGGGRKKIRRR